ncbi:hypothetical protein ABTA91_18875, partial [Acinetobacter baumannii]
ARGRGGGTRGRGSPLSGDLGLYPRAPKALPGGGGERQAGSCGQARGPGPTQGPCPKRPGGAERGVL